MDLGVNNNEDIITQDGDFVIDTDARSQIMYDLLAQGKGNYKENPDLCFNSRQLINSRAVINIDSTITVELKKDGFSNIEINSDDLENIKIYGDFDDLQN